MQLTEQEQEMRQRLCLPLDGLDSLHALESRVQELNDFVGIYKIGKEAFTEFGPAAVRAVQDNGGKVFLDLKYHDIPNTVAGAVRKAAALNVYMLNVHAAGGSEMMRAAFQAARDAPNRPRIIAVTLLTSLDEGKLHDELLVASGIDVSQYVAHMTLSAVENGLDGIVCSANDLTKGMRQRYPARFLYVTPGIKAPDGAVGRDQVRVSTPYGAVRNGATHLVVGRAITDHATPEERQQAAYAILQDMARAL